MKLDKNHLEEVKTLSMKSVTEILGGAQILFPISFEIQDIFEEYLTEEHRAFLAMLSVLEEHVPRFERSYKGRGRRPHQDMPIIRAFLAKAFLGINASSALLLRLRSDSSLRKICGFSTVPSPATFSRRLSEYANTHIIEQSLYKMVRAYHQGHIVGHISRDSTAIEAREKPKNNKKEVKPKKKRRRGRPRKDEERPPKEKTRLERQMSMPSGVAFKELNKECTWGCKKNSQGNVHFWKGYKLHLDVTDIGIPVAAAVTGANVHDSQVAIPLEKLTERNVIHLYSLMDAAYDAPHIRNYIEGKGRVALIDRNKRRKATCHPMDEAEARRFRIRSTVERANGHLKDCFLPSRLTVRGYNKVNFMLLSGVAVLASIKILQHFILPVLENTA
jgi:transposase